MSLLSKLDEKNTQITSSVAYTRLAMLFDDGNFSQIDTFAKSEDGDVEVVAGFGTVDGSPVYAFAQNAEVASGGVGRATAMKISKVYNLAAKTGTPIVGVYDSKGARISQGIDALSAYGDMLVLANNISGVVPQISVVLGTCGGTAAMIAASADVVIMSEKAEMFLGTDGDASAKNAQESGLTHITVADDESAMEAVKNVISKLPLNNLSPAPMTEFAKAEDNDEFLRSVCENIQGNDLQTVISAIVDDDSIIELQKEFAKTVYTALATIGGCVAGIVAVTETIDKDAVSKSARFVQFCDAFAIPVITIVNTNGFKTGCSFMIKQAAKLANVYAEATTPKISLVVGKAIGASFITLAGRGSNSDMVFAWPSAEISALEEDAAVTILYSDRLANGEARSALIAEYKENVSSPFVAAASGNVDDVIDPAQTRDILMSAMDMLAGKRVTRMPKKHSNMPL